MTPDAFASWIATYCTAIGAGPGVAEVLGANYKSIVLAWKANDRELGEIAFRLVSGKRIPKWPNEHLSAIGNELDAIRADQSAKTRPARTEHGCPVCEGLGLVVVPHPCCVYQGRVTGYYDHRARVRRREVVTVAVICSASKCWAGERAVQANWAYADERKKPKLLTMDAYMRRVGLGFEPTIALREWEREQAAKSRAACPPETREQDVFRSIVGSILARQQVWAEQPYRDEAEVDEGAIPV